MSSKKTDHCIIRNNKLFCSNCGGYQDLSMPIAIGMFAVMVKEFNRMHKNCIPVWKQPKVDQSLTEQEKAVWWKQNGERGRSSETIFTVLSGDRDWLIPVYSFCHPCDPDDFRRCWLLLQTIREWKPRIHEMKEVSEVWAKLVDNWDKLTEMLEEQLKTHKANGMYKFMQELGC